MVQHKIVTTPEEYSGEPELTVIEAVMTVVIPVPPVEKGL